VPTTTPRARSQPSSTVLVGLDHALLEVRRLVNRPGYRRRLLGPVGRRIELSTVRILHAVDQAPHAPSIGAVASILAIDPSTASRLVDQRVAEGLLERSPDPEDRRRVVLRLTTSGEALVAEVAASRREMLTEITAGWTAADRRTLETLLTRLVDGFGRLEDADHA